MKLTVKGVKGVVMYPTSDGLYSLPKDEWKSYEEELLFNKTLEGIFDKYTKDNIFGECTITKDQFIAMKNELKVAFNPKKK